MSLSSENVLVLNSFYLAIKVCSAQDAVVGLVKGRAQVIDDNYIKYDFTQWAEASKDMMESRETVDKYAGVLRSPSVMIFIPQVVIYPDLGHIDKVKAVRYSRKNVFQRDENTCQYCEKRYDRKDLTLDHVIPKSKGGASSWTNIVTACRWCNQRKGSKTLSELRWTLKKSPRPPNWKSHIGVPFKKNKKQYWEKFLM